jgi:hypothetical protein
MSDFQKYNELQLSLDLFPEFTDSAVATTKNQTAGIIERSAVADGKPYASYKENLRIDFWYSCAYCSITEFEAQGIGFEIDHYCPQTICPDKKNVYSNLMLSCQPCNRNKDDYFPDESGYSNGHYVINPDEDDPRSHFQLQEDQLQPTTSTGEFNEVLLDLNRMPLQRIRELRRRLYESSDYIAFGVSELLRLNIDILPPEIRGKFLSTRRTFDSKYTSSQELLEEVIRAISQSPLIDPDLEKSERLKKRKQYLRDVKAINYDSKLPETTNAKKGTKLKRKSK